LHKRASEELVT